MTDLEKFNALIQEIEWGNWKDEEGIVKVDSEGRKLLHTYMDLTGVLYSKLEWIRETLNALEAQDMFEEGNVDYSEHRDTIDQVQELLALLSENKILKIIQNG